MFVINPLLLKRGFILAFVDILEDIFEAAVVFLHDRVFCGHEERHFLLEGHFEGSVGEACY